MGAQRHDLVVIGAGTAGFAAVKTAHAAGRDVLLVTGADELGGTCILRGCMPAKTLLAAAHAEGEVEKASELGVSAGRVHVDLPAIIRRKRALVDYFAEDRVREIQEEKIVRGDARFVAQDAIVVDGRRIEAERFVIATGARNEPPPIAGIGDVPTMTTTGLMDLTEMPRRVAVVGGGPAGCAFAQWFARLGADVTLLQDGPELLRAEDPDVGAAVRAALGRDGVDVVLDAEVRSARSDGETAVLTVRTPHGEHDVRCDRVMLATNRRPAVAGLDLGVAGITGDGERGIAVDATLRSVSNPRVYAAGDVIGRRSLVHTAEYAGALAADNAFSASPREADWDLWETHAVYTAPQVAVAGLTERACRERGIDVAVATLPASEVGIALVDDEPHGFVKMLARRDDGRIAGVAIVTAEAIDLIGEAIVAIARGMTARELAALPHLHPTLGELLGRVAEQLG